MGERTANDVILDAVIPADARKDPAKKTKPPETSVMEPRSGVRLSPHPPTFDLGEHVIGSVHRHTLDPAVNLDPNGRDMTVQVLLVGDGMKDEGHGEFQVVHALNAGLSAGGPRALPISFTFAPTRPGTYTGIATIKAHWPDGLSEEHTVHITARARKLEDPPEQVRQAEAKEREKDERNKKTAEAHHKLDDAMVAENATHEEPYKQNAWDALKDHADAAGAHVVSIANRQRTAILAVQGEAFSFVPVAEHESEVWRILGKLALQIGVAGIAAVVGASLGPALAAYVGLLEGGEKVVDKVAEGLTAAVEDGIKLGVDAAYEVGTSMARPGTTSSNDPKRYATAFFTAQHESVNNLFDSNMKQLQDRHVALRALLRKAPDAAPQIMAMITRAFGVAVTSTPHAQTQATRTAWIDYVAQTRLGAEHGATNTEKAHEHETHGLQPNSEPMDGMLDLFVEVSGDNVVVRRARVFGVARPVLAALSDTDLTKGEFPIRILLHDGGGVITRDEHGVIRASGWRREFGEGSGREAQLIARAEQIAARVCGRTLKGWGISSIETNDEK